MYFTIFLVTLGTFLDYRILLQTAFSSGHCCVYLPQSSIARLQNEEDIILMMDALRWMACSEAIETSLRSRQSFTIDAVI